MIDHGHISKYLIDLDISDISKDILVSNIFELS